VRHARAWDGIFGVNAELNLPSAAGPDSALYRQLAKTATLAFGLGSFSQMGFVEAKIATAALLNMKPPYTLPRVNAAFAAVRNFRTDILCSPWYFGKVNVHIPNNTDRTVTPSNGKMVVKEPCFKISAADPDIASSELQSKFGLSERQAKAVLALTLSRLTRLERGKIDAEYEEVIKTIAYLESVLASDQKVRMLIKDEMDDLAKKYGDDRRTEITDQEASELSAEDLVPKEEVVVTLTHRGYVKRQPLRVFRAQKRGGVGLKGAKPTAGSDAPSGTREEDYALHLLTTHTHASMLFFTQSGRVFQLRVHEVPERERQAKGVPVNNLIDIDSNERITAVFVRPETEAEARYMLMVTKNGYIKKTALAEYANVRRNGLIAINLQEGDELDWVTPTTGSDEILIATELGKAIRFSETEVRAMGRDTQGVIGIKLGTGDAVAGMATATPGGDLLVITQRGYGKRTPVSEYPMHHRAGQGVFTLKVTDRVGKLTAMRVVSDPEEEVLVISASGMVLRTQVGAISRIGRQTQGVIVMRIAPDDQIVAIAPVAAIEDEDVKE